MNARAAALACSAWLLLFATISWMSVRTKSPTVDEPVQSFAAWTRLRLGDFRVDLENPPLWEEWAALPNPRQALHPDFRSPDWVHMPSNPSLEQRFPVAVLFDTPGVDGAAFVNRSRAMMLVLGILLGALVAWWSWRIGGAIAAIFATALFALDPGFLAHAPLVKNDVAASLAMLALAWLVWETGRRATIGRVLALLLVSGASAGVKFSCLLFAPMTALLLIIRSCDPAPWEVFGRQLQGRLPRAAFALALCVGMLLASGAALWAMYRFRFSAAPFERINTSWILHELKADQITEAHGTLGRIHSDEAAAWRPDLFTRTILWGLQHEVLPEAWLNGLLSTYATTRAVRSFLLGGTSMTGWWYYFPLVMAWKTPLATLLAWALAAGAGAVLVLRRPRSFGIRWLSACALLPPALYLFFAMRSHMDIGVRHILPVYPFGALISGSVAAVAAHRWTRPVRLIVAGLVLALSVEVLPGAPNYLAFFNTAAGGASNGLHLLGDSNLDWGQDLPLLADWQRAHPDEPLALAYFGMVDPAFYGIRASPLPGIPYVFGTQQPLPNGARVAAVSASYLQGLFVSPAYESLYARFRAMNPREILGGTIYLYDLPNGL
jgi:hypothetical protein